MHSFKVGDYVHTVIHHLDLYGEPKTELHGKVVGFNNSSVELEVPYYGVFNVIPNKLIKETDMTRASP